MPSRTLAQQAHAKAKPPWQPLIKTFVVNVCRHRGNVENGKCGNWGHNDPALFPQSDGKPNYMYKERCCPWTTRGSTTIGFPCHDLPEGATCSEANQCGSYPKQRPSEDGSGGGTNDPFVAGMFCGHSPIDQSPSTSDYANYDPKERVEQGSNPNTKRQDDRLALLNDYEYDKARNWDPSNLLQKCTKALLPGEPCCDEDGSNCHGTRPLTLAQAHMPCPSPATPRHRTPGRTRRWAAVWVAAKTLSSVHRTHLSPLA
jgi:hypothetical protein